MKEITSKKTKLMQIIPENIWDWIVAEGIQKRFIVKDIPERNLKNPPVINTPEEIKDKKHKS